MRMVLYNSSDTMREVTHICVGVIRPGHLPSRPPSSRMASPYFIDPLQLSLLYLNLWCIRMGITQYWPVPNTLLLRTIRGDRLLLLDGRRLYVQLIVLASLLKTNSRIFHFAAAIKLASSYC